MPEVIDNGILTLLKNGTGAVVIYLYVPKDFDSKHPRKCLQKLSKYDIIDNLLNWIYELINRRRQS